MASRLAIWDEVLVDADQVDAEAVCQVLTHNGFATPSKLGGFPEAEVRNLDKYCMLSHPQKALLVRVVQRCSPQIAPSANLTAPPASSATLVAPQSQQSSWMPDLGIQDAFLKIVGNLKVAGDGNFDKEQDCCVCWHRTSPSTTYRIPCGHLICTTCLPQFTESNCPMKCKTGSFKRAEVLARYNLVEPPPARSKKQPRKRFGRTWVDEDDFEPVASGSVNQPAHAVVFSRCNNEDCPHKGLEKDTLQLGLGVHEYGALDAICGPCGHDMELIRFSVAQCFMKVEAVELFNNHRTKLYGKVYNAIGRTLTFSTNGFYRKLELHLAAQPFVHSVAQKTLPTPLHPLPSLQYAPVPQQNDIAWKGYASDKQYMQTMAAIESSQPCRLFDDHAETPLDAPQCPVQPAVVSQPVQPAVALKAQQKFGFSLKSI